MTDLQTDVREAMLSNNRLVAALRRINASSFARAVVILLFVPMAPASMVRATCHEPVLLPVVADAAPGAMGSVWQTHLAITNLGDEEVAVVGYGECFTSPCGPPPIQPEATIFPDVYGPYLHVPCGDVNNVSVQLRVQDLSRKLDTWGTSIPVVREADTYKGRVISIVDAPNDMNFRSTLRIYNFRRATVAPVTVRVHELDATITEYGRHDELVLELQTHLIEHPTFSRRGPGYLEIPLWLVPQLTGRDRLRIEVEGPADVPLWAFVSATNNETQHVTVLPPS